MNLIKKYPYLRKVLSSFRIFDVAFALLLLIIPVQKFLQNHYNNFTIFQHSSFHFFAKTNLYIEYPGEYYDVFLYNPTFAMLFTPVAYLPTLLGIFLWVGIVLSAFYFSVRMLPMSIKGRLFILGFTLLELITSLENLQINPAVAAFILFTFLYIERKEILKSSPFPAIGLFTKVLGVISGVLYIARRSRIKDYIWPVIWFIVLLFIPLVYYSPSEFITMYRQWFSSLSTEHSINTGISMMGMITAISGIRIPVIYFQSAAILLFITSTAVIFFRKNYDQTKWMLLSYIMIWIIIFNHDSESATYIIASTAVAIWYVNSSRTWLDTTFLIITFILTVLSPSDLFPAYLRKNFVVPYCLKALGPTLVWIKIQITLFLPEKTLNIVKG